MARIKCKVPSTGYTKNYTSCTRADGTTTQTLIYNEWVTLMEAPDYSVPDTRLIYSTRDPNDTGRAIRPGETFIMTPIFARNTSETEAFEIYVELLLEYATVGIPCPGKMIIPAGDTVMIPVQGRSLLKRNANGFSTYGDRIRLKAGNGANGYIYVWGSGEEKLSAEHVGVIS